MGNPGTRFKLAYAVHASMRSGLTADASLLLRDQIGGTYRVLAVQLLGLLKCAEHRCWTHNKNTLLTTHFSHTLYNGWRLDVPGRRKCKHTQP